MRDEWTDVEHPEPRMRALAPSQIDRRASLGKSDHCLDQNGGFPRNGQDRAAVDLVTVYVQDLCTSIRDRRQRSLELRPHPADADVGYRDDRHPALP